MLFCLFHSLESQSDTSCFIEHVNMTRKCTVYYKKRRYITRKRCTHNFREMSDTREMSRSMYLAVSRRRHGAKGLARGGREEEEGSRRKCRSRKKKRRLRGRRRRSRRRQRRRIRAKDDAGRRGREEGRERREGAVDTRRTDDRRHVMTEGEKKRRIDKPISQTDKCDEKRKD